MRSFIAVLLSAVGLAIGPAVVFSEDGVSNRSGALVIAPAPAPPAPSPWGPSDVARRALAVAETQLGVPYRFGAATPGVGFDCSGLVWWAYRQAGVSIPRITFDQAKFGVVIDASALQPGDLVFTRGGEPLHDLGHVAIYAGDGEVLTAPSTGAVVTFRRLDPRAVQMSRRVLGSGA